MKKRIAILFFLIPVWTKVFSQCGLTAFTLSTPSAVEVTATSVQLNWGSATGGTCTFPPAIGKSVSYIVEYKLASTSVWQTGPTTLCTIRTANVGDLIPGEVYNFRISANATCNSGANEEALISNQISVVLEPPTPVLINPTSIASSSFVINWELTKGATQFLIDVSTSSDFLSFVGVYNGFVVNAPDVNLLVTGLDPSTSYFFRLRALNINGSSGYSFSGVATTLASEPTAQPTALIFSNVTTTSMDIGFTHATGSFNGYLVIMRSGQSPTGAPVDGESYSVGDDVGDSKVVAVGFPLPVFSISMLSPNTVYYFDIFSFSGSGTVFNYLTTSPLEGSRSTLSVEPTAQPTSLAFSKITATSLDGSFTEATGNPSGYIVLRSTGASPTGVPVDGMTYASNDLIGDATVVSVGAETSFANTGLAPNTVYHFDVIAYNGSGATINYLTASPLESSRTTLASEPSAQPTALMFSNVTATSLDGSFTAASGNPTGYIVLRKQGASPSGTPVDGTTYSKGDIIGDASIISIGSGTSFTDTDLAINTAYYYTIFSYNGNELSINYLTSIAANTGSSFTLPDKPQDFKVTDQQQNLLRTQWQSVAGAIQYEMEVSTTDDFNNLVPNYNPKIIPGTNTEHFVSPLAPGSIYYLRLRARNSAGASAFSSPIGTTTRDGSGGSIGLGIVSTSIPNPPVYDETNNQTLAVSINNGGLGTVTGFIYHRTNSSTTYAQHPLSKSGQTFSVTIDKSWVDDLGMQFYVEVRDQFGNSSNSGTPDNPYTLARKIEKVKVDVPFGKSVKNYRIISLPYVIKDGNTIAELFEPIMHKYDISKWRMGTYGKDKVIEYNDGLSVQPLKQGQGYWFITRYETDLSFDQGITYGNSTMAPFTLQLKKGWNQIGNPFPFNIKWADVLRDNGNPTGLGSYREFNPEKIHIEEMDGIMEVYSGGFVFADNDIELIFKTTLEKQPHTGGRIKRESESDERNLENWLIPITVMQGEVVNTLPGIGMRQDAVESKDKYDLVESPRFVRFTEFNTRKKGFEYTFARDVVGISDSYTWYYSLEHNSEEPVSLQWDNVKVTQLNGQLILHDVTNHVLVNMSSVNEYTLSSKAANFKIYYNKSALFEDTTLSLGVAYPNPFQSHITIPFDYSMEENNSTEVMLTIFNALGRKILEVQKSLINGGLRQIEWDGLTETGLAIQPGMYLYELKFSGSNGTGFFKGKMIKR